VQHFYRSMDFLLEHEVAIQEKVFWATAHLMNLTVDLIFFDTANPYFEMEDPGDSDLLAYGKSKHKRDDLPGNIELSGYAPFPSEALARADIVLNLSNFEETFGRTVLEAMAAGRPVVAYNWGALPELRMTAFKFLMQCCQAGCHGTLPCLRLFCVFAPGRRVWARHCRSPAFGA
jgi:hypothetical protein